MSTPGQFSVTVAQHIADLATNDLAGRLRLDRTPHIAELLQAVAASLTCSSGSGSLVNDDTAEVMRTLVRLWRGAGLHLAGAQRELMSVAGLLREAVEVTLQEAEQPVPPEELHACLLRVYNAPVQLCVLAAEIYDSEAQLDSLLGGGLQEIPPAKRACYELNTALNAATIALQLLELRDVKLRGDESRRLLQMMRRNLQHAAGLVHDMEVHAG